MPSPTTAVDTRVDRKERLLANRYRLHHQIGSGRFGPVYSAVDTTSADRAPGNGVAVQLLWSELSKHKWLVDRFKTDFIRLRSWRHDNIVAALDFGQYGDRYYWVTSLLDGASLRSIAQQLEPELMEDSEARAVIGAVGRALQYAHAREKVHGDIRLENIFITSDFVVKVLDFAPPAITHSTLIVADDLKSQALAGTDCRDDVYGLACVAYELLSGRHPYGGSCPEEVRRCELKLERIDRLSRRTWKALRSALEPVPEKRTPTVRQFMNEFGTAGADQLTPTEPPRKKAVQPRAARTVLRRVSWAAALASLIGLVYLNYPMLPSMPSVANLFSEARQRLQAMSWPQARTPDEAAAETVPNRDESSATLTPADKLPLLPGKIASETESSVNSQAESTQLSPLAASVDSNSGGESLLPPATIPESATETVGSPPADDGESAAATSEVTAPALLTKDRFEFENRRVTVSESSAIATLVLRRLGDPRGETTVSWWTVEETAVADEDYANFGVLVETFGDGEEVREIYIPLVVDSIAERTERFHVELSYDSMSADRAGRRAEIIIVDDDS